MSKNTDPFEEFEFKPLTEGLGFHKKKEATPEANKSAVAISEIMSRMPKDLDFLSENVPSTPHVASSVQPLPTTTTPSVARAASAASMAASAALGVTTPPAPKAAKQSLKKEAAEIARPKIFQPIAPPDAKIETKSATTKVVDESVARAFPHLERLKQKLSFKEKIVELVPAKVHFGAAILDGMVTLGMTFIFLMSILMVAKIDLVGLLTHPQTEAATRVHLTILFFCVLQLYFLSARSFFGASLGEWAFDMQLGTVEQQRRAYYPLQVVFRTLITILTGVLVLPIISLIANRDISRYFGGLELLQKKQPR